MASTGIGNGILQTGISLGAFLNALASTATAITSAGIVLPAVSNAAGASVWIADLELLFSAAVTPGAGSPNLQGVWLVANSGTNYDGAYGASNSQLFPLNYTSWTYAVQPSVSLGTVLRVPGMILPYVPSVTAANPKLVIYNNLSSALSTTVTATIYPAGGDIG